MNNHTESEKGEKAWDPILPHRAIFICDENCSSSCEGCRTVIDGIKYTTDVIHAKNGPVVNVREWETRFEIKQLDDGLLYYCEKANEKTN